MIAASTSALFPLTLPWETGEDGAPIDGAIRWEGRAASVIERQMFEAEVAAPPVSAREVLPWEWADVAQRAIGELGDIGDRERLSQVIALARANALENEDDRQLWIGLQGLLGETWPEWQALAKRAERRRQMLPVLACQWFLKRRNGEPLETDRDGRLTNAALATIDPMALLWLGARLYAWAYGWEQAGNSAGPSPSADGPKTSPKRGSGATTARAGSSSTKPAPKTRR